MDTCLRPKKDLVIFYLKIKFYFVCKKKCDRVIRIICSTFKLNLKLEKHFLVACKKVQVKLVKILEPFIYRSKMVSIPAFLSMIYMTAER